MFSLKLVTIIWLSYLLRKSSSKETSCKIVEGLSIFQNLLDELTELMVRYEETILKNFQSESGSCNTTENTADEINYPDDEFLKDLDDYLRKTLQLEIKDMEENFDVLSKSREEAVKFLKQNFSYNQFEY